jgi:hypothetical protein
LKNHEFGRRRAAGCTRLEVTSSLPIMYVNGLISQNAVYGQCLSSRHPCKSLSREKTTLPTRATEERAKPAMQNSAASHVCLSAVVPAFAEPDIHSLSPAPKGLHRRLSLCSLPVPKQSEGSLGSLISFAQSANSRTWQPARCVIP